MSDSIRIETTVADNIHAPHLIDVVSGYWMLFNHTLSRFICLAIDWAAWR